MRRLDRKGQSLIEYVIVLTGVIAAIILALPTIREKIKDSMVKAATEMNTTVTDKFNFSN